VFNKLPAIPGCEAGKARGQSRLKGSAHGQPLVIRSRPALSVAVSLLQAQGLPVSDITDQHLEHFFYNGSDESPTALVGVEIYGDDALLRSLLVADAARTRGLGSTLVDHAEDYAASLRVTSMYLLTPTAERFFERRGYRRVDRALAPRAIQATPEFAGLCPASSAFMIKRLAISRRAGSP
jgi:amino-acid N-acetyltransferase